MPINALQSHFPWPPLTCTACGHRWCTNANVMTSQSPLDSYILFTRIASLFTTHIRCTSSRKLECTANNQICPGYQNLSKTSSDLLQSDMVINQRKYDTVATQYLSLISYFTSTRVLYRKRCHLFTASGPIHTFILRLWFPICSKLHIFIINRLQYCESTLNLYPRNLSLQKLD